MHILSFYYNPLPYCKCTLSYKVHPLHLASYKIWWLIKIIFFIYVVQILIQLGSCVRYVYASKIFLMFQERCVAVDTISLVARILNRSKAHLQSMLLQSNSTILEDFYVHLVRGILVFNLVGQTVMEIDIDRLFKALLTIHQNV